MATTKGSNVGVYVVIGLAVVVGAGYLYYENNIKDSPALKAASWWGKIFG